MNGKVAGTGIVTIIAGSAIWLFEQTIGKDIQTNVTNAGLGGGYDPTVLAFFEAVPYILIIGGVLFIVLGLVMSGKRPED